MSKSGGELENTVGQLLCDGICDGKADGRATVKLRFSAPAVLLFLLVALGFHGVDCGESPILMGRKTQSARMQFTRFPNRCPTGRTGHGVYLLHGEFLGFHSAVVFLRRRWLNR